MSEMKKLYNNNVEKAIKSCAVIAREKRRSKALCAFSIKELLQHFGLYKNDKPQCPKCQETDSLKITTSEFACTSCKQKGHTIKLVTLAKNTTHWKAINYIENLQQNSAIESKPNLSKIATTDKPSPLPKKSTQSPSAKNNENKNKLYENTIAKIKAISLVETVTEDGIKLKRQGNNLLASCPFHNDRTPSFVITPSKNLWNCLGACNRGGTVIDYIMLSKKLDFRQAVAWLQEKYNLEEISHNTPPTNTTPKVSCEEEKHDSTKLLNYVVDYYHKTLKSNYKAQEYLKSRGLEDEEMFDKFKIGFSNRTLGLNFPVKSCTGGDVRKALQNLGVIRESGHEHLREMLTIPIFDENDNAVEIYGRRIFSKNRGAQKHSYLRGPHKGIFNREALKSETIILTESLIDALSFYQNGFTNVTSSFGVQGFTEEMKQAFVKNNIQKVYIAYDNDDAGNSAAIRLAKELEQQKITSYRVRFQANADANDFIRSRKPAQKHLQFVIDTAQIKFRVRLECRVSEFFYTKLLIYTYILI